MNNDVNGQNSDFSNYQSDLNQNNSNYYDNQTALGNNYNNESFNQPQQNFYQPVNDNYQVLNYNESFQDDNNGRKKSKLPIIIIIAVLIVLVAGGILYFFIFRNKSNDPPINDTPVISSDYKKYNQDLISYAKTYFVDESMLPSSVGMCKNVTLKELNDKGLVVGDFDNTCDQDKTYVSVCKLNNGNYHYQTTFACSNENLNVSYGDWTNGDENDLDDTTEVRYLYMLQKLNGSIDKSSSSEVWEDEFKNDDKYSVVDRQTFYRYRDLLYRYSITNNYYYQKNSTNDLTNKYKVSEYYTSSPDDQYKNKDSEDTVYKWYVYESEVYNNGEFYSTCPDLNYPVKGEEKITHIYTTELTIPINSYTKRESATLYQTKNENKWSDYSTTKCDITDSDNCRSTLGYHYSISSYKWYTNSKKVYYPSKSSNVNDEVIYYKESPVNNAKKDESTKTVAYKWYKIVTKDLGYAKSSPMVGSVKNENDKKMSEWSNYSTSKPASESSREIEQRNKLILVLNNSNTNNDITYIDMTNDYMTFDELITFAKNNNYNINSLSDIDNIPEFKYQVKLQYRKVK